MDDKTDNPVLGHLRAIRTDLAEVKTDLREVKTRLGLLLSDIEQIRKRLNFVEA
ncbi:hypothetical protein [Inquilinus sp. Marseille-Q2685]|uniref:hypothetical protein n=1 Tax=Inquilinus sp. Marseille-Q2685 TaxID=2866581 RepID=UPI001CE3F8C4|nr:hypothetical protein [Inquilinus sp. Marseille-Q2685]